MSDLEVLKMELREEDTPFFTDEQLKYYLYKNGNDVEATIYECLILKSEDTTLNVSGMNTADTSSYFKRLASRHRPNNSGSLGG